MKEKIEHHWSLCLMCGPMVVCGACGNNCCNGGYGKSTDGTDCTYCPSAYEMQKYDNGIKYYISKSKLRKHVNNFFEKATENDK